MSGNWVGQYASDGGTMIVKIELPLTVLSTVALSRERSEAVPKLLSGLAWQRSKAGR